MSKISEMKAKPAEETGHQPLNGGRVARPFSSPQTPWQ